MKSNPGGVLLSLDDDQRQAAEALVGPVVILAGAGAGKTRTITHRIANGIMTGTYAPEKVMALSFTRKAAAEVQERLIKLGVFGAQTKTFHSAALSQLGFFWERFTGANRPKIIRSKISALEHILQGMQLSVGPEGLRDIAAEIEWRKTSMLKMVEYEMRVADRKQVAGLDSARLIQIMQSYENLKKTRNIIDFEDVLLLTAGMLEEEPKARFEVRERYRFFTVDEYQDISPIQHHLLKVWLGQRQDLCVVGDVSQTIYSFAGASSSYLLNFKSEFPKAREFKLEKNYRSKREIITLANNLMRGRPGALMLEATREGHTRLGSCEWFANEKDEANAVAWVVKKRIQAGAPAANIAILYRSHSFALHLEDAFERVEVPTRAQGESSFFDRPEVKRVLVELRANALAGDKRIPFQILTDILRGQGWSHNPPAAGDHELAAWETLNAIFALFDEMPEGATIQEFSDELRRRSKLGHDPVEDAVTLSTVHAAKGLEWPIVWLIGNTEGSFPISFADTEQKFDEERRLFYVAITRAKDELYFSASGSRLSKPSRFLKEAGVAVLNSLN